MHRYDLTDRELQVIEPLLPKSRGIPREDDQRVLSGIFWILRTGAPWRDLPDRYGPYTTVYNRFVRWRKAGVWERIMAAVNGPGRGDPDHGNIEMIDSTSVRVHQHAAGAKKGAPSPASAVRAAARPPKSTSL